MRCRLLLLIPLLLAASACAEQTSGTTPGGPVTPTPVPLDVGPSAKVTGNTMPTGIVVQGKELILYLWVATGAPVLATASRDSASGTVDPKSDGGICTGTTLSEDQNPFFGLTQCVAGDGSLIEFGAYKGEVSRVIDEMDGKTTDATFTRWTGSEQPVTIFWLQRRGNPNPSNVVNAPGKTSPLPAAQYPRITVYSTKGKAVASAHIRPGQTEQKGG
ncbi:hypothetical protein [Dactylosporangium sp. CS-033363]|uniref:hypothetical protein n=1 Tax=Dactylosporangium sp. CS-033363 TaxID=3239935 RepID=UPI003D9396E9